MNKYNTIQYNDDDYDDGDNDDAVNGNDDIDGDNYNDDDNDDDDDDDDDCDDDQEDDGEDDYNYIDEGNNGWWLHQSYDYQIHLTRKLIKPTENFSLGWSYLQTSTCKAKKKEFICPFRPTQKNTKIWVNFFLKSKCDWLLKLCEQNNKTTLNEGF